MINTTTVLVPSDQQMAADLEGETVILDIESGTYFGLDSVGASVWALLDGKRDVAAICEALTAEYQVSDEQCLTEVTALLEQLLEKGLVEEPDAAAA